MDAYRKKLKARMKLLCIPAFIAALLGIYNTFWASPAFKDSFILEYQCGAALGLGLLCSLLIIRYRRLLCDEKKLQMLYNRENDERRNVIRAKAGLPMILVTSVLMLIAGIVAGYFSFTVFAVLTAAAMCQMVFAGIVKLLYEKKYR